MTGARLSERAILGAALRLGREGGVEALTMRTLAEELGVSPMAAYHHVRNRDAVLLLVADEVMGAVHPPPEGGTWDARLWAYMTAMGDALASVPGIAEFLLRQDLTAEGRRYMQQCIAVIREGGFGATEARQAFIAVYRYMWGGAAFRAARSRTPPTTGRRRAGAIPSAEELISAANLELGYRALVAGLDSTLREPRATS